MWLRKNQRKASSLLLQKRVREVASNTARLAQNLKDGARRREQTRMQQDHVWRQNLAKDLDAGIGRLTYDDMFHKLGEPHFTIAKEEEIVAVWLSGRFRSLWLSITNPWLLRLCGHGSRLELTFNNATRLVSWKHTDW